MRRRRICGHRGERDDQVSERMLRLEPATGADAKHALDPSWTSSSKTIVALGQPIPVPWTDTALPSQLPVVEEAPLAVHLDDVGEERLGDVLRAQGRLGERPSRSRPDSRAGGSARRKPMDSRLKDVWTSALEFQRCPRASSARHTTRSCASAPEDPVERVFLEDVARRSLERFVGLAEEPGAQALCHVGVNAVPSGHGCGTFAREVVRASPRMLIGESAAVWRLWERARARLPRPREDRPGQAGVRPPRPPGRQRDRVARSDIRRPRAPRAGVRGCMSWRSGSTRFVTVRRLQVAPAPRSRKGARGSGPRTGSSSSRPRRRRTPRRCSSSRCRSIPLHGGKGTVRVASPICVAGC